MKLKRRARQGVELADVLLFARRPRAEVQDSEGDLATAAFIERLDRVVFKMDALLRAFLGVLDAHRKNKVKQTAGARLTRQAARKRGKNGV